MKRLALFALIAAAARSGAQETVEREREERAARERGEREHGEKAEKGAAAASDAEALYAAGAILGAKLNAYGFSKKELETVQRGFADAASNRKLKLRDADLEEWGPKVDAMLERRGNPRLAAEKERGRRVADEESKRPGAERLPSGVVVVPERLGDGALPAASDRVRVKYEGRLVDGKSFDRSESAEFRLDQVIGCWTQGVQKVKVGGKARLVCPAATAYGDQGRPPQIPGGATLVFTVELLDIRR